VNTYAAIPTPNGRWAVEWSVDDNVIGRVPGTFDTEVEALFAVCKLACLERAEAPNPHHAIS